MKIALMIVLALIAFAIVLPLLHLVAAVLLVVGGAIVLMAAWKVLFGPQGAGQGRGGPPAIG
jgi:small neutral amino acid transporter SnatA (MarC family)